MQKNISGQKLILFAFDSTTNLPKTGDAANLAAFVSKDYGSVTALTDTTATEMDSTNAKGYYIFDLTQSETNADTLLFTANSSTGNIVVVGVPAVVFTTAPNFSSQAITSAGGVTLGDGVSHGGTLGSSTATLALSRLNVSSQTSNTSAITAVGNGTGHGVSATSGGGATGNGINATSSASNGHALNLAGAGTGDALKATGGATGHGFELVGGGTSGNALKATTTSGDAFQITATGASKHGVIITGGDSGTSDGLKLVAGTGGVGFRLDTLTASGAVTLSSTLTVSGATSLAAVSTSGTLTLNALTVSNATTLTGAVTASNAGNNIVGIDVAKISGDATAADNAESFFDGTGYAGTNNVIPTVTTVTSVTNRVTANADQIEGADATDTIDARVAAQIVLYNLDHLAAASVSNSDVVNNSIVAKLVSKSATAAWSSYDNTTDSLEALRDNVGTNGAALSLAKTTNITGFNDPTAAAIATAVWTDTTASDFTTASSPGKILKTQLGGAFTTTSSSVFSVSALANAPSGGGGGGGNWDTTIIETGVSASSSLVNDSGTQLTEINARQALSLCLSVLVGALSGVSTSAPAFAPAALPSASSRVTATTSASGRSGVTLRVPD